MLGAIVIGSVFATGLAVAADADSYKETISGREHGILFDGELKAVF